MSVSLKSEPFRRAVPIGLAACGVDKLFLQIHDGSFPGFDDEDIGRGSPYSRGARQFIDQVRAIGFNGIQLGPQGATAHDNPSPYDGTVFSRSPQAISLAALTELPRLLEPGQVDELLRGRSSRRGRVDYRFAFQTAEAALDMAYSRFARERERHPDLQRSLVSFREEHAVWLERDALYNVLFRVHGGKSWEFWNDASGAAHADRRLFDPGKEGWQEAQKRKAELNHDFADEVERYAFIQLLIHQQHEQMHRYCSLLGMKLYADLQVGVSVNDAWAHHSLFLRGYRMGAPPSRTNPDGQPWGFRVLDPRQYRDPDGSPGPVLRFVARRLKKIYAEYDGVRVDHPHGWVCPWVYRTDIADPFVAVQNGARLFSSPDLPDHPTLAELAYVRPDQLNREVARFADDWVRELDEDQIERYSQVFARLVSPTTVSRRQMDLVCEVLSTLPYPLKRVLERYGLGRFRVLQKVNPHNPLDVYRSELAEPVDWIMLGNHDTPPIWKLVDEWTRDGSARDRAGDLSQRLAPSEAGREAWAKKVASTPGELAHALFADLLVSRARNIMVFFTDLFGMDEQYNVPGTVNDQNWTLRVPPDYATLYVRRLAQGRALSLPYALSIALHAPASQNVEKSVLDAIEAEVSRLQGEGRRA